MILTDREKTLIVTSFRLVVPISETVGDLFYGHLFQEKPQYRALFPEDMAKQKRKLLTMLEFICKSLDWTEGQWDEEVDPQDDLLLVILALGRRHDALYGIPEEAYGPVEAALMWTLDQGLGEAFTPEHQQAWTKLYRILAMTMQMGAKTSRVDMELGRVA